MVGVCPSDNERTRTARAQHDGPTRTAGRSQAARRRLITPGAIVGMVAILQSIYLYCNQYAYTMLKILQSIYLYCNQYTYTML